MCAGPGVGECSSVVVRCDHCAVDMADTLYLYPAVGDVLLLGSGERPGSVDGRLGFTLLGFSAWVI